MSRARSAWLALGVAAAICAAAAWWVLRPGVEVAATVDSAVTVACAGSTGLDADACRAWGDATLAGAQSNTFEVEDLARLELWRPALGFAASCEARWFLQRYPDDPASTEEMPCPSG